MMHAGPFGFGAFGGAWGVLVALLVLAAAVALGIALTRLLLPAARPSSSGDDALEVLRSRFARGEIDEAEYLARRATLTAPRGGRS